MLGQASSKASQKPDEADAHEVAAFVSGSESLGAFTTGFRPSGSRAPRAQVSRLLSFYLLPEINPGVG